MLTYLIHWSFFFFLMLLLNYGTVQKFFYQTGRFSFKSFGILSFFPGLGGRHFQRRGQLHNHRHPTFRGFLVIFQLLPKAFQAWKPGLLALVCRKGCGDVGLGLVKGSEFVLWCFFCNDILQSWIFLCINFSMKYELSVAGLWQLAWLKGAEEQA